MVWLVVLLLILFVLALFVGRYPSPGIMDPTRLSTDVLAQRLVFNLRLPRMIAAVLLGMGLAASGAVLQMIFGNPLVEPGFLGVSQGAGFGAAVSIIFISHNIWAVQITATLFAFLGMASSYFIARRVKFGGWLLRLVLAGIAISALFSSGLGILKYVADPLSELPEITFWLLGTLWAITWPQVLSVLPAVLSAFVVIYLMRWRLNLLSLNDQTSFSLGAAPVRERLILLVASVVATAALVSISGMVSWVGLIIPHIARRIYGADARRLIPASMLIGACFTLIADTLARTVFAGEIPLGILTSLLGAGIFLFLMIKRKGPLDS